MCGRLLKPAGCAEQALTNEGKWQRLHSGQKPVRAHHPGRRGEVPAPRPTAVGRSSSTQHTEGREHDRKQTALIAISTITLKPSL